MPPSKQVVDRRKDALAVHASVETHRGLIADELGAALKPHLRSGEKLPDLTLLLTLLGRRIHASAEEMAETDTAHQTELADDDEPREKRNKLTATLVTEVVELRESLDGLCGSEAI